MALQLGSSLRASVVVSGGNVVAMRPSGLAQITHGGEDPARIRATLARSATFASIPITAIEDLTGRVAIRRVGANARIVAQDDACEGMFLVMSGRVKMTMSRDNGREVTLATIRAGESFGEAAVFDQSLRSPECMAIEPTVLLMFSREELLRHLQSHPRTAISLLAELTRRNRKLELGIGQLALCDVHERLVQCLVRLAREENTPSTEGGLLIRRRPTQQELANMVGSCRETISRAYNLLGRNGAIAPRGRSLIVTTALLERAEKKKIA
jgi:CRP/FNR family transcriptional regulator, cyclic AMP receptor protein